MAFGTGPMVTEPDDEIVELKSESHRQRSISVKPAVT